MYKLFHRGEDNSADASPTSTAATPSPSASPVTGPARPIRLVYCDDMGKFHMDPEAVATLQLVKEPIGVVSVCGRARQGKSFILNQLLGRSSEFQVAPTHRPCTKGLWLWSTPLKRTALDGTEYNLLLLDSEGIDAYDQTGTYSTQIFSLAVLLSSMFIYNQMGGIDEAALDRLSLVTQMTKHIRVRASGGKTSASELGQFSPIFVWLLRDFYLDLTEDNKKITPRDYLELALRPVQGSGRDIAAKNEIRDSIRALFPDRECFTLVRPLNKENDLQRLDQISLDKLRPEFRSGLDALTKFVFERTRPKQVGATMMTGPVLIGITESYLNVLNHGAVPTISSSWQVLSRHKAEEDQASSEITALKSRSGAAEARLAAAKEQAQSAQEKFSAGLRIGDLNDFIAPSQACIVSLKGLKSNASKPDIKPEVSIAKKQVQSEPVKISLKDCLACSGCVTSAETVMLEKQSLDEFLSNINKGKTVIVSLSPQSRASLAVHFGISPLQVFKKLTNFFKSLGVKAVFDTSCSRDLTLVESCMEFMTRYRQNQLADGERSKSSLPMIASACPGWICYAEKQLGSFVLPNISKVKSPQQTIGTIIKQYLCQDMGLRPEEIYHVTVMPCYDKKLEAARDDFVFQLESHNEDRGSDGNMISEVDSVLTTGEVMELIQSKDVDFKSLEESPLDRLLTNINEEGYLYGVHGSSGGYAETIFRYAAKTLFGRQIDGPLNFKKIRNSDFQEVTLEVEGKTVLKFALCYGFRNLQNVVRKLKTGTCDYQFVEIMACPSGCLNGGGQIKPKTGQSPKELSQLVETVYMENVWEAEPFDNPIVRGLYDKWLGQPGSEKAQRLMHTQYHHVEKSITSQLHNW